MNRSHFARSISLLTLVPFLSLSLSCGGKKAGTTTVGGGGSPLSDRVLIQTKDLPPGLDLRVSDGKEGPPAFDRNKLPPAKKLADAEAQQLLSRAKPLQMDPADQQAFALRPNSQPAPRTGNVIKGQFPPPPSSLLPPLANDAGQALRVLRYMPEGAVPLAPELSITFSQPMVAVTSQSDAAQNVPVKLTPTPKGHWRWIGTRTVLFDPEIRFPQATTYQVEVPTGTKSANGGVMKEATRFTFETPAPTLRSTYPSEHQPQRLDVPMFALFDQKIDPAKVIDKVRVRANGAAVKISMLDRTEIEKDKQLAALVKSTIDSEQDGRWLAFRATSELPRDAAIEVTFEAGTPSAEGPNTTKTVQRFGFRTFPPLRIEESACGYDNNCPPGYPFNIRFNNPIDTDKWDDVQLTVTPDVPSLKIVQSGSYVTMMGLTKARTTYKVVVSGGVLDEFGQTLGKDTTLEWKVTDARPTFFGPSGLVVADPMAKKPSLDIFTTNYEQLKVRLYQVGVDDYDDYLSYLRNQWNKDKPPKVPGKKVFDQLVKTSAGKNELVETRVELAPALKNGLGHVFAIVEPHPWKERWDPPRLTTWIQATKLGIDAYVDSDQLVAMATELATGKPASGIALNIAPFRTKGTTDDKGMATLELGKTAIKGAHILTAQRGDDIAFVTDNNGYWTEYGSWTKQPRAKRLAWYVIDDRKMYKPGEEVTLKGWLRVLNPGKGGDIEGTAGAVSTIAYTVKDSRNNQIGKGSLPVSPVGSFDGKFTLPKTPNLGSARLELAAQGRMADTYYHQFQIEEFRRPEFEVTANASQGPFLVGQAGDVTVNAKYYSGGPLAGAPVQWYVTASQTAFTPPNRDEFVFGQWIPWWGYRGWGGDDGAANRQKSWQHASKTDASGAQTLHLDFLTVNPALPYAVQANASVTDVNRQQWSASAALLVHPSKYYVGLKPKKPFVEKGQPFEVDVIGVDVDGKFVPGTKIEVKTVRLDWEYKKGKYTQKEVDPQTCSIVAEGKPLPCQFGTKDGGTYQVTALIVDDKGRPNQTKLDFWVTGGDRPPARELEQERVQLIPDKKEYKNGDTAELLVQAPFYPAEALVSWRRSGIVKTERFTMTGPTTTIKVPIMDAMVPNMAVQIDLVGAAARLDDQGDPDPKLPKRPAYAVGAIDLPIPAKQRTLAVTVAPDAPKIAPGESSRLTLLVKDAAGRPVPNAEAAVIVVDEAILSLTGYKFPNPIDTFYAARGTDTRDHYSRAYVKLAKPDVQALQANTGPGRDRGDVLAASSAPVEEATVARAAKPKPADQAKKESRNKDAEKDDDAEGGEANTAIAIRSNFNPLAAFSPSVKTDGQGRAIVDVKVPDNLTRYRIVAVATAGEKQFGKGESSLIARLPLMVRPSPPRFLNFGDTFRLPVVVQNQTDTPMTVKLAVRATNAQITDGAGREVSVPANDRVEVQFPAAAELAGTARFQIVGAAGKYSDATNLELPVWTPATTEAFATYGVIDEGAPGGTIKQPVALPGKVVTQFGGIEVTTASTNLQALTDALIYLVKYPFECAEQRASRVLAVAALKDVLAAFKTKDLPSQAAMEASVTADIERLSQMQNYDGGYAFWERGDPSNPYLTVYVTSALAHAKAKGFTVNQALIDRAKPYLKDIESKYPWYYSKEVRWAISSYALYTRKQLGDLDIAKAQKLLREATVEKLPMEATGWLIGTMAQNASAAAERKQLVRHVMNKVSETAGAANFTTTYSDGAYLLLASDRRVDAVMLESLIQEDPKLDLIPKVVTGLLAHRKAGRWLNTQENTFALLALDRYFQTYEKTTPDFVARVWLGNDYAGDHAFKGRSTDYFTIPIPMSDVATHDKQPVTIQKDGKGRLYYRIGMKYAPASLKLEPADYGFVVTRVYEGIDDPKDVTRLPDGTWKIKAGARVRVKLNMVNENRRYHVALVDPLPAGLETMNPALAVTGPIPTDPKEQQGRGAYWWWYGPWYEHQNMRDERVEAFAALLWEGVHEYSYVARATTPGNFVVPPPKAEEMYMPETFGRGGSDRVIVE